MKKYYSRNNILLKKLIIDNLLIIAFLIIFGPIYFEWRTGEEFIFEGFLKWFLFVVIIFINIPSTVLYVNYYIENRNTRFNIDYKEGSINIIKDQISKKYKREDVLKSTYHLGIYYKNAIDRAFRLPMLISDFGYWEIEFKNGDKYFLSNILHDFLLNEPLLSQTKYRFRFYPYINKKDKKQAEILEIKKEKEKTLTESFVDKFREKNERQLLEILENKKSYQKEALNAAEILMNEKKLGNNVQN